MLRIGRANITFAELNGLNGLLRIMGIRQLFANARDIVIIIERILAARTENCDYHNGSMLLL
jgi:hypothetical protein